MASVVRKALADAVIAAAFMVAGGCHRVPPPGVGADVPQLSGGVTVGEVSATSAVLWARCDRATTVSVSIDGIPGASTTAVTAATDFTAKVVLAPLAPQTRYGYRVHCGDAGPSTPGVFRTAPDPTEPAPVRFAWSGDVGGQNVCRDRELGYPIFATLADRDADFFVALGDMIYADDPCEAVGRFGNPQLAGPPPALDLGGFRAHWRYNWDDPTFQRFRRTTAYFGVWDDHEIRNDSGPHDDTPAGAALVHLLPPALQAFIEHQPLIPPAADPTRLYRTVRWGKHLALFLLDTRQYRDALAAPDGPAHPKTMLGAAQLAWLEQELARSDATWNVIVASVPLSIPTGSLWRDGFADGGTGKGYEREAAQLFRMLRAHAVRRSLWITTDVHFATGFRYQPFDDDPSFAAYEFTAGPLNAGVYPTADVDPTFRPQRLFMYAPRSGSDIESFSQALDWFNFGTVDITADGTLTVAIVNGHGQTVFHHSLPPP